MARRFDGSAGYMINTVTVNPATVTMACWIKPYALPGSEAGIFGFQDNTGANDKILSLLSSGVVRFFAYDGSVKTVDSTSVCAVGKWTHICGMADGVFIRMFFNGNQEGIVACGNTFTGYSSNNVRIGGGLRGAAGVPDKFFTGAVRDAAFWTGPMTGGPIKEMANGVPVDHLGAAVPSLRADHWLLDEASGLAFDRWGGEPGDYESEAAATIWPEPEPPPLRTIKNDVVDWANLISYVGGGVGVPAVAN